MLDSFVFLFCESLIRQLLRLQIIDYHLLLVDFIEVFDLYKQKLTGLMF